jgi:phosphate transport system permease protein
MGFAVIPIIFTISEDSFSSVPSHLTAASLALGASRWQTALRVVLPTASPASSPRSWSASAARWARP